VTDGAININKP